MVGNGDREVTNLVDVYDKACWGSFGLFSCLFSSSRIDKTVPTIFPTALSGGIIAILRGSVFICYKHDFTFYTERMWSLRPMPPFPVSILPHRKCVRQWLLNLHVCQKGQSRGRTVNWKQEAGGGWGENQIKRVCENEDGHRGLSPVSLGMETLHGNMESWSYSSIKF